MYMGISHYLKKSRTASIVIMLTVWANILVASDLWSAFTHCQSTLPEQNQSIAEPQTPFRYLIVKESLVHNGRVVIVMFDIKHFTEGNLRELFRLLSRRFPKPDELHVGVITSLQQFPTPEEEDYEKSSPTHDLSYVEQVGKYPNATYTRTENNEEFQYSLGEGQPQQRVVIKRRKVENG